MVLSVASLPRHRPSDLRLMSLETEWFRVDTAPPEDWGWQPFLSQRNRFDTPVARVRYAAKTERGAFRERFGDRRRRVRSEDALSSVVRLTGRIRVVDLRQERTLDCLGLDAEVCTGRAPRVLEACSVLAGRVVEWYGDRVHGIAYTSRTTPQTSVNLAFLRHAPVQVQLVGRLADRRSLLAELIADDGFRIDLPGWV